jgi:hypothetical protein
MDKIWSLFSGNSNTLKFLLSPVRFTKCLGVRVPLRPPRKKSPVCRYLLITLRYVTLRTSQHLTKKIYITWEILWGPFDPKGK